MVDFGNLSLAFYGEGSLHSSPSCRWRGEESGAARAAGSKAAHRADGPADRRRRRVQATLVVVEYCPSVRSGGCVPGPTPPCEVSPPGRISALPTFAWH